MAFKQFITFAFLAFGASAMPQGTNTASDSGSGTSVTPQQTSEFNAALKSYYSALTTGSDFKNIGVDLFLANPTVVSEIKADPSMLLPITATSVDLVSLASAPPSSFPSYSWYSGLDSGLVSSIQSLQTSAAIAIASIDQSVLGTSFPIAAASATSASSSSSSGAANAHVARPTGVAAMGAAIGALGAAVALL